MEELNLLSSDFSLDSQYDLTRILFANNLKNIRKTRGVTAAEVAGWFKISERNYKKFEETGENGILPKTKYIPTLCQNLNISADELLGIESTNVDETDITLKKMILKYKKSEYFLGFLFLCERHELDDAFFKDVNSLIARLVS